MEIQPVILSGGSGTRLWPLSRKAFPKQFLSLVGDVSLFQQACLRLVDPVYTKPIAICNERHRFIVAEQFLSLDIEPGAIVLEPVGRNTAPAALTAALMAMKNHPESLVLLLPSDHLIKDADSFNNTVKKGMEAAGKGHIVTFGIQPDSPHTGYGYIETTSGKNGLMDVLRFVEKPDSETAATYLEQGGYYWNAGIFLFSAAHMVELFKQHAPQLIKPCQQALEKAQSDLNFLRLDEDSYSSCEDISFDYAIMERTNNISCIPLETNWNDLGSWSSMWDIMNKDADGNAVEGDVFLHDSSDCLAHSKDGASLSLIGLQDVIAVATKDAVLVTAKKHCQNVKSIVDKMKADNREAITFHSRVYRPWGWYEGLEAGDRYQVKCLMVTPGGKLSSQSHHHRAEHWVVVSGSAEVTINGETALLTENQSTYIPIGATHRLYNPGRIPALLIEVQSGSYLGEDDIIRYDDIYGRSGSEQDG